MLSLCRRVVLMLVCMLLLTWAGSPAFADAAAGNGTTHVAFSLLLTGQLAPAQGNFGVQLVCNGEATAQFVLQQSGHTAVAPVDVTDQRCTVNIDTEYGDQHGDRVLVTVSQHGELLARTLAYAEEGLHLESTEFVPQPGELHIVVSHDFTGESFGTRVRVMEWNIWQGGREAGGEENVDQLAAFIREQNVDILFLLETYGSGPKILATLNEGLPADEQFTGVMITERPEKDRDNLWIFTRYPVVKHYATINETELSSFNFGGIKVMLPDGQELNLFNTWLWHEGWAWGLTNDAATEIAQRLPRTLMDAEIVASDLDRRMRMARIILDQRLPMYLGDDTSPIILAGDFNTLPYADWTAQYADAPGHYGLVLPWPVTQLFEKEGFIDTYRWANPDAGRYPGSTWSPQYAGIAPGRIDYIWVRGRQVHVLDSYVLDRRLPGHERTKFPFYSDHAAVITDLYIVRDPLVMQHPASTATRIAGDMDVSLVTSLPASHIDHVAVRLVNVVAGDYGAEHHVFRGNTLPNRLTVDTLRLDDGAYDLIATIQTVAGAVHEVTRRITVANWVVVQDELLPPEDSAWFGILERTKTSSRTSGWEFVGGRDDVLFEDSDRMIRTGKQPESLTWRVPDVRHFAFGVYGRDADSVAGALSVAVSADQVHWHDVQAKLDVVETSASGWTKFHLTGTVEVNDGCVDPGYIRLTVTGDDATAMDIQIGHATLKGLRQQ